MTIQDPATAAHIKSSKPARLDEAELLRKMRLRLWINMLRTTRHIENTLRERFKSEFEATLPRFDVMAALFRNPDGMTMTRLSESLMVSNGNVTGIVERLVEEGLVNRSAHDTDRRTAIVMLTPDGQSTFSDMADEHHAWINALLEPIPQDEIEHLTELLQGLRDAQTAEQQKTRQAKRKKKDQ
ncbi:MAG: MarR family transcriptional regulator [Rhodospirillaceae bacterium]|jgi:DNA-binding MarR family transcriptional regulator|uniref:MarR family winged helix-turn-helix transcriptional regulator n=1 Tax=unclassified Hwanghaeella TaxID=2605944 RepID=UPI000C58D197|nr:MarR family transcriptional regulator [Rhodospirillales bacterium]MAX48258.1 MarR family transcriptional regulator [Rhodospirillaceae bacterium]|tara:strand:- start:905 stop:1456 length:552 start_codon:yes stop_codon:yes gene_type:complete